MNRFALLLYVMLAAMLLVASPSLAKKHTTHTTHTKHTEQALASESESDNGDNDYVPPLMGPGPVIPNSSLNVTDAIEGQFDGVLIVKSIQTSCEVALASDSYGYVAANCLMVNGNMVGMLSDLQVAVHGPQLSSLYPITNVTIHPNYDPASLANNIAVVKYKSGKNS
ncbi:hypothetical protein GGI21_004392, partial [Coemansia aciculifera]